MLELLIENTNHYLFYSELIVLPLKQSRIQKLFQFIKPMLITAWNFYVSIVF